jgi:hypothetical protein
VTVLDYTDRQQGRCVHRCHFHRYAPRFP